MISSVTTVVADVHSTTTEDDSSMEMATKMHFVTSTIIGTIFVIIGIVGNILSISVWTRPKMRSSTGTYLIGQAIADMGLLLFFFITDSLPMMAPEVKKSFAYGVFFSYIGYPIFFLFVICSIWFTVGVTVDRYILVCWISRSKVSYTLFEVYYNNNTYEINTQNNETELCVANVHYCKNTSCTYDVHILITLRRHSNQNVLI